MFVSINSTLPDFFDLLFPRVCASCEKLHNNEIFCDECGSSFSVISAPRCIKCGTPLTEYNEILCKKCKTTPPLYQKAVSVFPYEGAIAKAIKNGKYSDSPWIFRKLSKKYLFPLSKIINPDYYLPVPSIKQMYAKRGFNHTLIMAKELTKNTSQILKVYKKNSSMQAGLKLNERMKLTSKTFEFGWLPKKGKILIIDDVITTESTVTAITKGLINKGLNDIYVLTICRTLSY